MDSTFAMGHVVIRRKRTVVGAEVPDEVLFRCIQSMNSDYPFNTCYTGGELNGWQGDCKMPYCCLKVFKVQLYAIFYFLMFSNSNLSQAGQ